MPPHCDTMDGPVITAAKKALDTGNVNLILPFVHREGEAEVRAAFARVAWVAMAIPQYATRNGTCST